MQVLYDAEKDTYSKEAFAGVPEDVTVHLPASLTDEQRTKVEDFLHSIGIPTGAAFEYYDLRQGGAAADAAGQGASAGAAETTAAETTAAAETAAAEETTAEETTAAETTAEETTAAAASGASSIDGKVAGTYSLNSYKGMSIQDFAKMIGTTPEDASKMIQVKVKDDGTAEFISDGEEPETVSFTLDGEKVVMEAGEEKLEGTLKDGVMTLVLGDEEITLVR
jgi:hypothetical protein